MTNIRVKLGSAYGQERSFVNIHSARRYQKLNVIFLSQRYYGSDSVVARRRAFSLTSAMVG